jgi:hypothetical protein
VNAVEMHEVRTLWAGRSWKPVGYVTGAHARPGCLCSKPACCSEEAAAVASCWCLCGWGSGGQDWSETLLWCWCPTGCCRAMRPCGTPPTDPSVRGRRSWDGLCHQPMSLLAKFMLAEDARVIILFLALRAPIGLHVGSLHGVSLHNLVWTEASRGCWHVGTTHYGHGALPVSLSAAACKPQFQRQTTP